MNHLFANMIDEGHVVIYIDDILIFTITKKEHDALLRKVLQRLKDNNLFLKLKKYTFRVPQIEYLGLIISYNQIKMDPSKTKTITEWPTPRKVKEV